MAWNINNYFLLLLLTGQFCSEGFGKVLYNGDQVVQLMVDNGEQLDKLTQFIEEDSFDERGTFVEFWNEPRLNTPIDLYIRHDKIDNVFDFLHHAGYKYEVIVNDIQE